MCGIVGYTGPRQGAGLVLEGLKRLEYRGYDSAGLAVVDGGRLEVVKAAGKIAALERALAPSSPPATPRWHALGDARRSHRRERASPHRLRRHAGAGAQRHHRKRHGAAGRSGAARAPAALRDRQCAAGVTSTSRAIWRNR